MQEYDDFTSLGSDTLPITLQEIPEKIDKNDAKGISNRAAIKELLSKGVKKGEIAKLLNLSEACVYKHTKYLESSDLSSPTTVNKACKALHYQLDTVKSLDAVKMVYNHVNRDHIAKSESKGSTVININFDGLSNTQGIDVIDKKITVHDSSVQEGVIVEDRN